MPPMVEARGRSAGLAGAGALAGGLSALVFTALHHLFINPIWWALPAMLGAGVLCGASLAWSFALLVTPLTAPTWYRYNAFFVAMFVALGLTSLATFDPVTTIAALLQAQAPPTKLIARAFPMTGAFILGAVALLCLIYRPRLAGALAVFFTTTVMVLVLGLNISVLGFVSVPRSDQGVLLEIFLLLLALGAVNAILVVVLQRNHFAATAASNPRLEQPSP